jgi:ESCRT-I complex subunit VPS28
MKRLVEIGLPATIEHAAVSQPASTTKYVAETVQVRFTRCFLIETQERNQLFITLIDALKLNLVAVDQIHPLLCDLVTSLHQVLLPSTYQGKDKLKSWLATLNQMKSISSGFVTGMLMCLRASDEISPEQVRQMSFDLERFPSFLLILVKLIFLIHSALAEFHRSLS